MHPLVAVLASYKGADKIIKTLLVLHASIFEITLQSIMQMFGGHYHWRVVQGCAVVMTPSSLEIYHQRATHCPSFSVSGKFCIFSLVLGHKFHLSDSRCKISEFSLPIPLIFQGKPAPY